MKKSVKKSPVRGNYHNDYSPKFGQPFDIYDKAKSHMKKLKKEERRKEVNSSDCE